MHDIEQRFSYVIWSREGGYYLLPNELWAGNTHIIPFFTTLTNSPMFNSYLNRFMVQ